MTIVNRKSQDTRPSSHFYAFFRFRSPLPGSANARSTHRRGVNHNRSWIPDCPVQISASAIADQFCLTSPAPAGNPRQLFGRSGPDSRTAKISREGRSAPSRRRSEASASPTTSPRWCFRRRPCRLGSPRRRPGHHEIVSRGSKPVPPIKETSDPELLDLISQRLRNTKVHRLPTGRRRRSEP